ncbi:hypothetical protein HS088_TW04G00901 [Tripterygium wilfordii]|uniref:AT-rich interactive domain-containing protein 2 n=1 Tax=Tripterygium wilfordii TaxID=458696 RepID=A0A7J7DRE0_TRIWF|nr:uncharacterized protein LOC119997281 [Tripterygium wilfordii]XP_038700114.1 uncharacterized protein LOC119997281 [Tripterygium wilfordii]KAF5748940.1 hypothetical protein HS088_TW04G00901 [Tripterygium wilfordii]
MVHKRPFGDDNSVDVVCKYVRQGEHPGQLGSTVPSRDAPHEAQALGADFYDKLQDVGRLGSASVPTISNGTDREFENISSSRIPHFFLVNSRVPKSDAALPLSVFPEFLEDGHKLRALIQSDEIFSSVVDHPPQISIGPEHQAYVPEWGSQGWTSSSDKVYGSDPQGPVTQALDNDDDGSMEKLMGNCIIPMPELEAPGSCYPQDVETKSNCKCIDRGSVRCVSQHVMEARQKLRENLGPEIFEELGFCDMGDEVAKKLTEEEEERFHEVVLSNPESLGRNFWDHFSAVFPSRTKKDVVSYYFNVFMLRKRAEQNRFDPQNIDSDNDEWQQYAVGVVQQDEDSVVESPTIQDSPSYLEDSDPAGHCHGNIEDENETSNNSVDIVTHQITCDEDYEGDVEDIAVPHVGVSADNGSQHFGNFKRSM